MNKYKTSGLSENTKVDLHMHTTASDGTWTPAELIEVIKEKEIGLFAVTDHDSVKNVKETAELAQKFGITFIPGIELNSVHKGLNIHILGHGIDIENKKLENVVIKNTDFINKKDDESIKELEKNYNNVSFVEYKEYENNPAKGGWKALNYIKDKGLCNTHKQFFELFESKGEKLFRFMEFVSPREAIEAIIDAGGIPVLAHPGAGFYGEDYIAIVNDIFSYGIKGIECYHPDNNEEVTNYCTKFCYNNDLKITAGSDCHGTFLQHRMIGKPELSLGQLKL
jgi:predicted metal-dependent phosphoesterase TrpH